MQTLLPEQGPDLLHGFDAKNHPYLGEDFKRPPTAFAGWVKTRDEQHLLALNIYGDLQGAQGYVVTNHGGFGAYETPAGIAPFLTPGIVVASYSQRNSGNIVDGVDNRSRYIGNSKDRIATHTPENLVDDLHLIIQEVLGVDQVSLAGGSAGTFLELLYAITHPEYVDALFMRGTTLGLDKETNDRYDPNGKLAQNKATKEAYDRFINTIPEEIRAEHTVDGITIARYYADAMNPDNPLYRGEAHALDLAVAFGILHLTGAEPETLGPLNMATWTMEQLLPVAKQMGVDVMLFARTAMEYFAYIFPEKFGKGRGKLLEDIGKLAGKSLYETVGEHDLVTPSFASEVLAETATASGLIVVRNKVAGGQHIAGDLGIQTSLNTHARIYFGKAQQAKH